MKTFLMHLIVFVCWILAGFFVSMTALAIYDGQIVISLMTMLTTLSFTFSGFTVDNKIKRYK